MPRMSYSRSMVGWKSWVIGISSMGREGFSGGGEQVAIGMQPLARRKVQSPHSFAQLLPRHDMPHPHAAEMRLVEQGEAGREQLAIDDAFAEPRDDAKADAPGQLGKRFADAAHIVRIDMLKAVAKDEPVDRPPVGLGDRKSTRLNSSH